jgi:tRNA threonylcarbamoyladenosine biosynthesis protein TsaE
MASCSILTRASSETSAKAELLGAHLHGGEVFEFISDLGGGKTTFIKGLAKGFGALETAASPTFTISYVYNTQDGKQMHHFDFYRLNDAGVVANELAEVIADSHNVVVVEWGDIVHEVLPKERIIVTIKVNSEEGRTFTFKYPEKFSYLFDKL